MAKEQTFTFIFDRILQEIRVSVPDKALASKFCKRLEEYQLKIRGCYASNNTYVKNTYMENPNLPLDRHKCAACFMVAFLEEFPIKEHELNRELMAISVGMLVLKIFIREECRNSADLGLIGIIKKNRGLKFPECVCDDEPYVDNWALGINCDRADKRLSVISLSNVLFWVERYNRMLAEIDGLSATRGTISTNPPQ
jgi:hypothetical protein